MRFFTDTAKRFEEPRQGQQEQGQEGEVFKGPWLEGLLLSHRYLVRAGHLCPVLTNM